MLIENGFKGAFCLRAFEDCFVEQGSIASQLHKYGLDAEGMYELINNQEKVNECDYKA